MSVAVNDKDLSESVGQSKELQSLDLHWTTGVISKDLDFEFHKLKRITTLVFSYLH